MKYLVFIYSCVLISCAQTNSVKKGSLKEWILQHETGIVSASDTLIQDYRRQYADSDWVSAELAIANSMSGTLGMLAERAGDSTNCIVVELTLFKDTTVKRRIFLVAMDSNCLPKLNKIELTTDSTQKFVYGKTDESFQ